MTPVLQDARLGLRLLRHSPGFTGVALLVIALGIGANTAIFSVVHATYFAALPYRDAERLVMVWSHEEGRRRMNRVPDFIEWRSWRSRWR